MATDEGGTARKLVYAIDEFRKLAPDLPAQTLTVFFLIAGTPGIRMKEIEKLTGLSSSAISRNVLALSERSWRKEANGEFGPGLDLVVTASDPFDPRAKVAILTPRGRKMYERVVAIVDGKGAR